MYRNNNDVENNGKPILELEDECRPSNIANDNKNQRQQRNTTKKEKIILTIVSLMVFVGSMILFYDTTSTTNSMKAMTRRLDENDDNNENDPSALRLLANNDNTINGDVIMISQGISHTDNHVLLSKANREGDDEHAFPELDDPCRMDQIRMDVHLPPKALLILRNPIYSIPSYHNGLYDGGQITIEQNEEKKMAWIQWSQDIHPKEKNNQQMTNLEYELNLWKKRTQCWIERYSPENLRITTYERLISQEKGVAEQEYSKIFNFLGGVGMYRLPNLLMKDKQRVWDERKAYPYKRIHPYTPEQLNIIENIMNEIQKENFIHQSIIEEYKRGIDEYNDFGAISQKHKLVYVHIPKSGGSTIEQSNIFDDVFHPIAGHFSINKMTFTMRNNIMPNDFLTATTIRNPCERFISAFYYLQSASMENSDRIWADEFIGADKSIDQFVNENLIPGNQIMDMDKLYLHFKHQHEFLFHPDGTFGIDILTCQEDFNEGLNRLYKSIGMSIEAEEEVADGEHKRDNSQSKKVKSCDALNPTTRDIILNTYQMDNCIFQYDNNNNNNKKQSCIGSRTTVDFMTKQYEICSNKNANNINNLEGETETNQ